MSFNYNRTRVANTTKNINNAKYLDRLFIRKLNNFLLDLKKKQKNVYVKACNYSLISYDKYKNKCQLSYYNINNLIINIA